LVCKNSIVHRGLRRGEAEAGCVHEGAIRRNGETGRRF